MKKIKTELRVLLEDVQTFTLDIKANAEGEIDDDDYSRQEEQLMKKLEKRYPGFSVTIVDIDCKE